MKKFIKNNIIGFVLGIIVATTVGVSAYAILASDIGFTPSNPDWKVNNLEAALNDLYANTNIGLTQKITDIETNSVTINNNEIKEMYAVLFTYTGSSNYQEVLNDRIQIGNVVGAEYSKVFSAVGNENDPYAISVYKLTNCQSTVTVTSGNSLGLGGAHILLFK